MSDTTTTTPQVYAAINAVQDAMAKEGIAKKNRNSSQGYNFRGIDDVFAALSPHLSTFKLCILPRVMERTVVEKETKNGGALFYTSLMMEFDFVAVSDGSKHTVCMAGEAMDSGDKSTNKAMSAAYKYACFQVFCIPTEGDNDADAHTHEPKATVKQPKAEPLGETVPSLATDDQLTALKTFYANPETTAKVEEAMKFYKLTPDEMRKLTTKQASTILKKCSDLLAAKK